MTSEFFVFTRCYAKEGQPHSLATTIQEVLGPTRQEPGCLSIEAFASRQDQRLFHIHSRWKDEAAFDHHLQLPHTIRFLNAIQGLLDRPIDVTRAELLRRPRHSGGPENDGRGDLGLSSAFTAIAACESSAPGTGESKRA